ncbi:MAG: glycosyltransferase family 9 protein [Chitinivibrionales bacterium]|nr:glycosyltransferase family 9 protein [Chitinivibrionales bacterium]
MVFTKQTDSSLSHTILVVLPNNLGDVIMATPMLEGIKAQNPDTAIVFLSEKGYSAGIENNPHLSDQMTFDRKAVRDALRKADSLTATTGLIELVNDIRSRRFDRVINLSQHSYTPYLVSLAQASVVIGRQFLHSGCEAVLDGWSQYLYAVPFARFFNRLHASDIYRRIGQVRSHHGGYTIAFTDEEKKAAHQLLEQSGVEFGSKPIAVFQAGAAIATKRWPPDSFVRLGKILVENGWQILISGAPAERELALTISGSIGSHCSVTAGKTTFRQALAQLCFVQGCVSADSALMHGAAACGVRVYSLFGSTNPVETGPYGDRHYVLVGRCSKQPCFLNHCPSMDCMNSIRPQDVAECILHDSFIHNGGCGVYRSECKPDGDFSLKACGSASSLYSDPGSLLTRAFFEPENFADILESQQLRECIEDSRRFIDVIAGMEAHLTAFLRAPMHHSLQMFELKKKSLQQWPGISQFWTALLNIALNSVALMDLTAAVRQSLTVCSTMRQTIASLCQLADNVSATRTPQL